MSEGHGDAGGHTDDSTDSRESSTESDWDQPWPGEQSEESAIANTPRSEENATATADTNERGALANTQDRTEIYVSKDVRGTDGWIDLGEFHPEEANISLGVLPEDQLQEYITDERSLDSRVQIQWGARVALGSVVAGLIGTWALNSAAFDTMWGIILTGVLLVLGFVWVLLYYRRWVYQVRADSIYLERGVVTHVRSLVPYVRIQHVDTKQSFVERLLGLSTLVVYTAGSRGADVTIPGLLPEEARDLQSRVKELAIEADGDDAL
jgi:membrane protein YdbS with pleckstrin-like domain